MSSMSVYVSRPAESDDGFAWQVAADPPGLVNYGEDCFAAAPAGGPANEVRIYVNGMRVIGVHPVTAGDFVRMVRGDGAADAYRVGERSACTEPGAGRRCEFTRRPITGQAVRCACGGLYNAELAEQIGHCPACKQSLATTGQQQMPAEELL